MGLCPFVRAGMLRSKPRIAADFMSKALTVTLRQSMYFVERCWPVNVESTTNFRNSAWAHKLKINADVVVVAQTISVTCYRQTITRRDDDDDDDESQFIGRHVRSLERSSKHGWNFCQAFFVLFFMQCEIFRRDCSYFRYCHIEILL